MAKARKSLFSCGKRKLCHGLEVVYLYYQEVACSQWHVWHGKWLEMVLMRSEAL